MRNIKKEIFKLLCIFSSALLYRRTIHILLFKVVGIIAFATVSGYAANLFVLLPLEITAQTSLELAMSEVNLYKIHQIGTIKEVAMAQANLRAAEYSTNLINITLSALDKWFLAAIPLCIFMLVMGVTHWACYEVRLHYIRHSKQSVDEEEEHF